MSLAASALRFQQLASRARAGLWSATFTLSTDTTSRALELAASPPERSRQMNEMRSGFIQATTRTILLPRSLLQAPSSLMVAMGSVFTCTADPLNPANVGTTWQVKALTDSNGGSEVRCECFRKD